MTKMHHTDEPAEPLIFDVQTSRRCAIAAPRRFSNIIFPSPPSRSPLSSLLVTRAPNIYIYISRSPRSARNGRRKEGNLFARLISNEARSLPFAYANYRFRDLTFFNEGKEGRGGRTAAEARESRGAEEAEVEEASNLRSPSGRKI